MNGKDIFLGLKYVGDDLIEKAEYGQFPASGEKRQKAHGRIRRPFLLAALIALLLMLVGCAVIYVLSLEQLVVVDHIDEMVSAFEDDKSETILDGSTETLPETTAGPFVAEKVLSLQGYEGSPTYNALQEWLIYAAGYTMQNPELRFTSEFQRPEAYTNYPCYSQEMVDKVDEICGKYGLHLLGKPLFITDAEGMKENGLSGVLSEEAMPRCFYGHLYQDGSFVASGELELSGDYEKTVQFQMRNIKKDAFYTVHLGLNNISGFVQWNYTTQDGYSALLALNDTTGLIFVENEGRFISIIIEEVPDSNMVFTGLPNDKQFLEKVCDSFAFSEFSNE